MPLRLPKLIMVIALASSIGLHWAFLQSFAWVSMAISYSQEMALRDALVKTFDGKHPCALCKEIAKERQTEKKSPVSLELKKFEFLADHSSFIFAASSNVLCLERADLSLHSIHNSPPTPPPRLVVA